MSKNDDFLLFLEPQNANSSNSHFTAKPKSLDYNGEYMMLLTASQFLTTIQNIALYNESLAEYDTSEIIELVHRQKQSPETFPAGNAEHLQNLLTTFRAQIEQTDEHVHTSNIRRLFESIGTPEPTSLERVLCYYLTKQKKTVADRDKIDLLVTRWGSFRIPGVDRMIVLRSDSRLQNKLEKIFGEFNLTLAEGFEQTEVLNWLDNYRNSLLNVRNMNDIVEKNYKSKLREFKLALGDFFYRPAVMAAVVDVNATLHNVLQEFYLSERSRLELYVDHAKKRTSESGEQNLLFTLMTRAEEMRRLLDETQAAIATHQVVSQSAEEVTPNASGTSNVDKLVGLLEETLQRTSELSQQIQRELNKK